MRLGDVLTSKYCRAKKKKFETSPGGPAVKTLALECRGHRFDPSQGTEIPHAAWHSQKERKQRNTH